MDLGKAIIFY